MTVFHCTIFEYICHATSNSRSSPHGLLHSPCLCLRAKLSVQVQHSAILLRGVALLILARVVYRFLLHKLASLSLRT